MTKDFDVTRPVQTRDGRAARIVCDDAIGSRPILALVHEDPEIEMPYGYFANGQFCPEDDGDDPLDLVNVPRVERRWIVLNHLQSARHPMQVCMDLQSAREAVRNIATVIVEVVYEGGLPISAWPTSGRAE